MRTETIYVAPGNAQCRVYVLPYALRPGQKPGDIAPQYRDDWAEIGLLNFQLRLVCIDPAYADLAEDIEGQMGGTYFEVQRPQSCQPATTAPGRPCTLWSRYHPDKGWEFNHLSDGHEDRDTPQPKCDAHKATWGRGKWQKEHAWLTADSVPRVVRQQSFQEKHP